MHENLILVDPDGGATETLRRVALGAPVAGGGVDEAYLQELLFWFPETLPVSAIDSAYEDPVPVCRELSTRAGKLDALYVNRHGRLTLVELKLWRNPQARREVIGQLLDYAKELASWGYEDFQREVSRTLGRKGNVPFELVRERFPEVDEAEFVDNVTLHLERGEFLLLIVGDGIREGVEHIVDFVQKHSGLRFNLALVESALYRDRSDRLIVQPRVLARTEIVQRFVVEAGAIPEDVEEDEQPRFEYQQENEKFWTAVLDGYAFADTEAEVPSPSGGPTVYVRVAGSGSAGWGLSFVAFLDRGPSQIGCYLTYRKDVPTAVRIFRTVEASLEELDADFERWTTRKRARLGFRHRVAFPLVVDGRESEDFGAAVSWMRDRLDRLVSTLHARVRAEIAGSG